MCIRDRNKILRTQERRVNLGACNKEDTPNPREKRKFSSMIKKIPQTQEGRREERKI